MHIKFQPSILINKKKLRNGGTFVPHARAASQAIGHWPESPRDGVSEGLGGGGGSKRAYRRFLYVRMQTVCLSFHEPLCAYPWPLPARDAFSNPLLSASWVRFLAGNVAVQHGPNGLFPAKNLTQLAENSGFENASLAGRATQAKDMRTVAHGSSDIQFASSRGGTSDTLFTTPTSSTSR